MRKNYSTWKDPGAQEYEHSIFEENPVLLDKNTIQLAHSEEIGNVLVNINGEKVHYDFYHASIGRLYTLEEVSSNDFICIRYYHTCTKYCRDRRKTKEKPTLWSRNMSRILFYALLGGGTTAGLHYYSAVDPIIGPMILGAIIALDLMQYGFRDYWTKRKAQIPEKYEAVISLGLKKDKSKIKYFKKQLKQKGFKVTSLESDFIRFSGTRSNFLKHREDPVVRISFIPGERDFFKARETPELKNKISFKDYKKTKRLHEKDKIKDMLEGETAWIQPWEKESISHP